MDLRIRPIVLFILHSTVSRCFSKDYRVSRIISGGCFWNVPCITILLLNTKRWMRHCFKHPTENGYRNGESVIDLACRLKNEMHDVSVPTILLKTDKVEQNRN